jgi:Flp pilus assembly protein TadG
MRINLLNILRSERGTSLVETALLVPSLLMVMVGAIDFGRAYYLADEIAGAAQAGAVYGSQNITDTTGITNTANDNAPDVSGLTVTPSWGCECSDGTESSTSCSSTPTGCSANVVYYATVTASATYTPVFPWKGISNSITIARSSTMRSSTE